ncbi:unnamed protein product [Paramecium sonneborni]|uniref:Cyclic nucleotide-binding domain-containing protein n=1 Tax=Paramecium sonneborni TaxID=65129 RepID=A0A8S1QPA5_9CILI|nr:unnamed protein product [Paramecium sonneborni]
MRLSTEESQENDEQLEDIKKKFIYQTEKMRLLLEVPIERRNKAICQDIAQIAGEIQFLKQYRDKPNFLDLCKHLFLKTYNKREYIFQQGETGDAFYVILSGSVKVYIEEPTEFRNFMQLKEIAILQKGDAFGEISLLYNSKRTAAVMAAEKSDLIILTKENFEEYLKNDSKQEMQTANLNKLIQFLEKVPIFKMFSKSLLVQICTKCTIEHYSSQQILIKQGTEPSNMYIIKQGCVKVIRKIKLNYGSMTSREELMQKKQDLFYDIDELSDYDVFGDYAILNEIESDCSYITAIPCQIITISSFNVRKLLPMDIVQIYKSQLKRYPDDEDLQYLFEEKERWNHYKRKLIRNIKIEKQNKKGFDLRLRLPELKTKELSPPINIVDIKTSDSRIYFKFLESKISPLADSKKKVSQLTQVGFNSQIIKDLELSQAQQAFQRKLKKLQYKKY